MTRQNNSRASAWLNTTLTTTSRQLPTAQSPREKGKLPLTALATVVALMAVLQAPVDAALIDGLTAYYDFNQSSGTSLPLVSGSGNNGVLNNMNDADWVTGQTNFGNALDFDGSDDFVRIADGHTNTVSGDDTHTVSMWVYPRSVTNNPVLLDAEDGGVRDYFIELGASGPGFVAVGGGSLRNYSGSTLALNTWQNIVFTKTGAGNSGDLYLDGVKLTTFSGSFNSTLTLTSDFLLGKYRSGAFELDGRLDDLAFWDRALSEAEVLELFNTGAELGQQFASAPVPEPTSVLLFGLGALGLVRHTRRRRRSERIRRQITLLFPE